MKKQTATEWLIEQVKSKEWQDMFIWHKEEVFNQAKSMEREQIITAHIAGMEFIAVDPKHYTDDALEYYNSEYKGGEQ